MIGEREAAERLGVALTTVERLVANGVLVSIPEGRRTWVTERSVETESARRAERARWPRKGMPRPERTHSTADNADHAETAELAAEKLSSADGQGRPSYREDVSDGLMRTREAAAVLGVTPARVQQFVAEGKLHPVRESGRLLWWRRGEVEALAMMRRSRKVMGKPGESLTWWGDRSRDPEPEWMEQLVTVPEAAAMLGVSLCRVRELVRLGRLPGLQSKPGKQGSRLKIPAYYVACLSRREEYRIRRERYDESLGHPPKLHPPWERWGLEAYDPCQAGPSTWPERSGLYTTRQAALRLGVRPGQVLRLMHQGRLHGWRKPEPEGRKWFEGGQRWWFFEQSEVEARRAKQHAARRKRWEKKSGVQVAG